MNGKDAAGLADGRIDAPPSTPPCALPPPLRLGVLVGPYAVLLLAPASDDELRRFEEATRTAGAGGVTRVRLVTVPAVVRPLTAAALLGFVVSWSRYGSSSRSAVDAPDAARRAASVQRSGSAAGLGPVAGVPGPSSARARRRPDELAASLTQEIGKTDVDGHGSGYLDDSVDVEERR